MKISLTSKMFYFMVPPYKGTVHEELRIRLHGNIYGLYDLRDIKFIKNKEVDHESKP